MMLCVETEGPERPLSLREVSELVGLARGTIRDRLWRQKLPSGDPNYRGANLFPEPDWINGKLPMWWHASITSWLRSH
jgi:predicted DNA-binding transcriptional regulator AlpA